MTDIVICGANGKMGKKVIETSKDFDDVNLICGIAKKRDLKNKHFPIYDNIFSCKKKPKVIIDFSSPSALTDILNYALQNKVNVVLCATGYDDLQREKIISASKQIAVMQSYNYSLGANLLVKLTKLIAKTLKDFDAEIIETHHAEKKDSPSGTAITLANAIISENPQKFWVCGRNGFKIKDENEIGINSVRIGSENGTHEIIFSNGSETITVKHNVLDKKVFATGAIIGAKFLADKKTGLFCAEDIMNG